MRNDVNRQWVLKSRPAGPIEADTFEWQEKSVPVPDPAEILVRNLWLSFEPAQRTWINDPKSYMKDYVPPVPIGEPMRAIAVAQIIESKNSDFKPGELVRGMFGWQDYAVARPGGNPPIAKLPPGVPPNMALSILGGTSITAYFGMLDVGRPKSGDTVVVSSAAGATGSVAGQIAKIAAAAKVIGIAGGKEKCAWLVREAHFDAAIDYKNEDVDDRLDALAPNGINVYFDNVGGAISDACLARLAFRGCMVVCGGVSSGYGPTMGATAPLTNYISLAIKSARMEGFLLPTYAARFPEAIAQLTQWVKEGRIAHREDIVEGLENAPETLKRLFVGANFGKQLLKIADPLLTVVA